MPRSVASGQRGAAGRPGSSWRSAGTARAGCSRRPPAAAGASRSAARAAWPVTGLVELHTGEPTGEHPRRVRGRAPVPHQDHGCHAVERSGAVSGPGAPRRQSVHQEGGTMGRWQRSRGGGVPGEARAERARGRHRDHPRQGHRHRRLRPGVAPGHRAPHRRRAGRGRQRRHLPAVRGGDQPARPARAGGGTTAPRPARGGRRSRHRARGVRRRGEEGRGRQGRRRRDGRGRPRQGTGRADCPATTDEPPTCEPRAARVAP